MRPLLPVTGVGQIVPPEICISCCATQMGDLKDAADKVRAGFSHAATPHVEVLHLAENAVSIENDITRRFLRPSGETNSYTKDDKDRF